MDFPLVNYEDSIYKIFLIKHMQNDIINDLIWYLKKKFFDCLYDKIIDVDSKILIDIYYNYLFTLCCGCSTTKIISVCDPNNLCLECQNINTLLSREKNVFGNADFLHQKCCALKSIDNIAPIKCNELSIQHQLSLYNPSRVLLVNACMSNTVKRDDYILYSVIHDLLIQKKYVNLLEFIMLTLGSSPKTIMDDFSSDIEINPTRTDRIISIKSSMCVCYRK